MKDRAKQHPAGLTACATTVLIWAATQGGIDLTPEVAAAFVGLLTAGVSWYTPRIK